MDGFGRIGAYVALFSEIGLVLTTTILAGILGGHWLDEAWATNPTFALAGMVVGMILGGVATYRLASRFLARFE